MFILFKYFYGPIIVYTIIVSVKNVEYSVFDKKLNYKPQHIISSSKPYIYKQKKLHTILYFYL